jgi:hypothetical protein
VEKDKLGKTPHFTSVELDVDSVAGSIVNARITGMDAGILQGKII